MPDRMLPEWYSFANDLGLYLGDLLVMRHAGLEWRMFTGGRKDVAYQRPVVMGFSKTANKKFNVDFDAILVGYGHRCIRKERVNLTLIVDTVRLHEGWA